ncbi:P63C domain protein [Caedimonas varicaedens]|uniref:p63C domain protein n=1 Tax=Caedimonas varicaedens TaxID=1629334 RepID=A0A0K8MFK6_9PROT|nr:P63C domain protein [Caedimonas varicaedens]
MMMTTETNTAGSLTTPGKTKSLKLLKAKWGSRRTPLVIGNLKISCYVLEDGTRVLSGRGMQAALGLGEKVSGKKLGNLLKSPRLGAFFDPGILEKFERKIAFIRPNSSGHIPTTYGYEATLLIDLCNALIDAHRAGVLNPEQTLYAEQAEMIVRTVAKVGIIALIDEATGYEDDREHKALQKILKAYMSAELVAWAKRFPDDFYRQIFRLKGWDWNSLTKQKKPLEVGKITRDIVYKRLAPGVLEELEKRNPVVEQGYRKVRHHQYLNPDLGHPALSQHLHALICFMRACGNWKQFQRMVQSVFPLKDEQMHLNLESFDKTHKN